MRSTSKRSTRTASYVRPLLILCAAGVMAGGCAQVDPSQFAQLNNAAATLHAQTVDTHSRVRKLQEVVYRTKVSLAPKLDVKSLERPEWLDTPEQFRRRETAMETVRTFAADLDALASQSNAQRLGNSVRRLVDNSETMVQLSKDVIATASVLNPIQPVFGGLVTGLFPKAALVSAATVGPALDYARRKDVLAVMQTVQPAFKARVNSLVPSTEVLAEYVMALKSEYLPDASALRDQLAGADRYQFDQRVMDLLPEFDAVAGQAAWISIALRLLDAAYAEVLVGLRGTMIPGDALRTLSRQVGAQK